MIREADLISFLPEFMRGYLELRKLLSAQQGEVQALEDMTEILKNNQFILSADEQGIEKFETMLEIAALDDDSLETADFVSCLDGIMPFRIRSRYCGTGWILSAVRMVILWKSRIRNTG